MASRPTVYRNSQGAILGGAAGPPVGAPGTAGSALSAMTALPLGAQHDRRPRAGDASDPVQRADGGLQCRDVGHPDLEHVALAAGDPPAVLDLGHRGQRLLDAGLVDRVALDDAHQRGDPQAHRRVVHDRPVAGDDPGRHQLADPLVHRGRGEAHPPGQLGVARPPVGAQQVDQVLVDGIDGALLSPRARSSIARARTVEDTRAGSRGWPRWPSWWCWWWRSPSWSWYCGRRRRAASTGCVRPSGPGRRAPSARSRPTTTRSSCASSSAAPAATTVPPPDGPPPPPLVTSRRDPAGAGRALRGAEDRERTPPESSHANISYAVFCLK